MSNGKNRLVDASILEQIEILAKSLEDNPDFTNVRKHRAFSGLRKEANRHSVEIEMPNGGKRKKGRAKGEVLSNLHDAYCFFIRNYKEKLDNRILMDTAEIIEPKLSPAHYRGLSDPTTRSLGKNSFIYPRDVADQMDAFLDENNAIENAVERAVHAHLHIARIHPFSDGNGRLARVSQNGILDYSGLPPAVTDKLERKRYLDLIGVAARSYREKKELATEQKTFYNYLAMKIYSSLTEASKFCSRNI